MQSLKLSENGRYLTYADGTPFFYMADTAWDLFYRLSPEEADHYFSVRHSQGFNAIQAILLGGVLGSDTANVFGRKALNADEDGVGILEQPARLAEQVLRTRPVFRGKGAGLRSLSGCVFCPGA